MDLSTEAREGLDHTVSILKVKILKDKIPQDKAFRQVGIKTLADTTMFLMYIRLHYPKFYKQLK